MNAKRRAAVASPYARGTVPGERYRLTMITRIYLRACETAALLQALDAPQAARRVRGTIKSLQGAARHAERRLRAAEDGHPIGRGIHKGGR